MNQRQFVWGQFVRMVGRRKAWSKKVNFSKFNKFEVLKVWGSKRYYFLFSWRCVFYNFFNPDVIKPRIRLDLILRCLLCRKCKFKTFCGPDLQNFECSRFCQFKVLTLILLPCHYFIIQLTTEWQQWKLFYLEHLGRFRPIFNQKMYQTKAIICWPW